MLADMSRRSPLRIGIGGPVGSGKTALVDALCKTMRERYRLGVITNDIFTREDMEFLVKSEALTPDRIIGVQTGGFPPTPNPRDAAMKIHAPPQVNARPPRPRHNLLRNRPRRIPPVLSTHTVS